MAIVPSFAPIRRMESPARHRSVILRFLRNRIIKCPGLVHETIGIHGVCQNSRVIDSHRGHHCVVLGNGCGGQRAKSGRRLRDVCRVHAVLQGHHGVAHLARHARRRGRGRIRVQVGLRLRVRLRVRVRVRERVRCVGQERSIGRKRRRGRRRGRHWRMEHLHVVLTYRGGSLSNFDGTRGIGTYLEKRNLVDVLY